jgi:type IV pilus assembly protein PilA
MWGIDSFPATLTGNAMKKTGFTLVEIMITVAIIALLAALAIPNLLRARVQANESSAISSLKTIVSAAHTYRASGNSAYPANLSALTEAPPYLDAVLGSGQKHGYIFSLSGDAWSFTATAVPQVANRTGSRWFFVDTSGVIRYNATGDASVNDSPLD